MDGLVEWLYGLESTHNYTHVYTHTLALTHTHTTHKQNRAGVSPYEEQELKLAVHAYVAKKEQAVDIFAKLGALRAKRRHVSACLLSVSGCVCV